MSNSNTNFQEEELKKMEVLDEEYNTRECDCCGEKLTGARCEDCNGQEMEIAMDDDSDLED